jgi:hypothetical protein
VTILARDDQQREVVMCKTRFSKVTKLLFAHAAPDGGVVERTSDLRSRGSKAEAVDHSVSIGQ